MRMVFCGACNPVFSLNDLASKVGRELPDAPDEIVLLLNGCRTGCLRDTAGDGKVVCVAGTSVDGVETEDSGLPDAVINAVRAICAR